MSKITRRDFVNGTLMVAGASMLPFGCTSDVVLNGLDPLYYPPALTGLRGSHPGSNTTAHSRAWDKKSNWGPTTELKETYDLIVVGGGISGLSVAYFYQKKHGKDKKILILDNHDDFGGHAKRNEHTIKGDFRLGHGGSQTLVTPYDQPEEILDLFKDIGVDFDRFDTAFDQGFYRRHKLGPATYFNKEKFGEDKIVKHSYCNFPNYLEGIQMSELPYEEAAQQAPLSEEGKKQLLNVLNGGLHLLDVPKDELEEYIQTTSYYDYLQNTLGVDDPGVMRMARYSVSDWGRGGTDVLSIAVAKGGGALGFALKEKYSEDHPYIHHFPDGNATVARLLVKKLIPNVVKANNAEEIVLAKLKYAELDKSSNIVRIRLNSTVVKVEHGGDSKSADEVFVNYINDNKSYRVKAKGVVMACYNMMIPHIVPNLPKEQHDALRLQMKVPLQYTTVGLKNWRAFKETGIAVAMSPGNMHQAVMVDFPVSIGGYEFTKSPDDSCVIQMVHCPTGNTVGAPEAEQFKEARHNMLALQFKDYEEEIRAHLGGMLPNELFNFDKDVESITVNRWAHGYAHPGPADSMIIGRQPFGRITIANSDSGGRPNVQVAMKMAYRAVNELG